MIGGFITANIAGFIYPIPVEISDLYSPPMFMFVTTLSFILTIAGIIIFVRGYFKKK